LKFKENWDETRKRFEAWWNRSKIGRPMLRIVAKRKKPVEELEPVDGPRTPKEMYLDVERRVKEIRNYCRTHIFLAESYPSLDLNIGPGSMATYLGSEPIFAWDTVWYKECVHDWEEFGELRFDSDNFWWNTHLELIQKAQDLAQGDFLVNIPDIIENLDILSAMRGPFAFCYDLIDRPELVKELVERIDQLYFQYYDPMHHAVRNEKGGSSYTAFHIWGPGKTAKVQCDFAAMMSPKQFREFAQPSLTRQCEALDYSLFHLDGPDCVRHVDALMEIEALDALQFEPGAGKPDGGNEVWYPIYEKVRAAGKSLWVYLRDGGYDDWVRSADRLVNRFGSDGLYLLFPDMEEEQAYRLIDRAEKYWS